MNAVVDSDKRKILLVEDEVLIAMMIQNELERYGYNVTVANNGEKSVDYVSENEDFDLILMDINLGSGIDGPEAARQILSEKDLPLIFHSSHSEPEVVKKTEEITNYGYVVKNSGITVLDASIKMAFKLHDASIKLKESNENLERLNSELVQSRKEIVESEFRFKSLFDNLRNAVAVYEGVDNGEDFIIKDFNKSAEHIEKIDRKNVIGQNVTSVFPGIKEFGLLDVLQRVWKSGKPEKVPISEYKDSRISGWRESYVFKLPSGEVVAVYDDFTKQKVIEKDFAKTKSILTAAFEHSHAGIAIAEPPDGTLLYVNKAGLLIRAGDKHSLIDNITVEQYVSSWNILHLDGTPYKPEDVPLARAVQKGETVQEEFIIRRDTHEDRYILANAGPVLDDAETVITGVVVFLDITERKLAQKKLKQSKQDLQESQKIARLGSWRMNVATNEVTWSEELYRMYGFDPDTAPPPFNEQMKIFTPQSWELLSESLHKTVETGEPYELELEMAKDGKAIGWMWVRGEAIKDDEGDIVELWGAAQDISEQKNLEITLRRSQDFLNKTGEIARIGGWDADLKQKKLFWTKATRTLHEVPDSYVPSIDTAFHFFPGESGKKLAQAFEQAVSQGESYDLVLDFVTAKGNTFKIRTIGQPEFINEHCEHVYGTIQDITAQMEYEKQKNRDHQMYKILFELHKIFGSRKEKLFDFIIEASLTATDSEFSFFGMLSDDEEELIIHSWSHNVMSTCGVSYQPVHFPVQQSGIWGNCIRQRKPVIYNTYDADIPSKQGLPDGHVSIARFMGIPIFDGNRIVAVGAVANKKDPYEEADLQALSTIYDALWDLLMRHEAEVSLREIEWLLENTVSPVTVPQAEYGDVTNLNTCRIILDSIDRDILSSIISDSIDLLETSVAVYEKNGDYAFGLFSSGWCRLMDGSSRKLCDTEDNAAALRSGKWICHDNCWNDAGKRAIETQAPVDIECVGGINLYALPIEANGEIIGAICMGYGDPPQEQEKIEKLSGKYKIAVSDLSKAAKEYRSRPKYITDIAKKRLHITSQLIGKQVGSKINQHKMNERIKELDCLYIFSDLVEKNESIDSIVSELLPVIQSSWQYPEITDVQITLGGNTFETENFSDTPWILASEIIVRGKKYGSIKVLYREERPREQIGPFLLEERRLLDTLSERLGRIIERTESERTLKTHEELLQLAIKGSGDAPWDWDMRNHSIYYSPQWWSQLGYEPNALDADPDLWQKLLHPDDKAKVDRIFGGALEKKENLYSLDIHLRHKDGHYVPILTRGFIQYDRSGAPIRASGTNQDLSDLKRIQNELQTALDKNSTFLRELNHRIKNSFSMIQGILYITMSRISDKQVNSILHDLKNRISTMENLFLLLKENSLSGKLELDVYCIRIIQNLQKSYVSQDTHIEFSIHCDPMKVSAHRASIMGMIVNEIITNSLKYAFPDNRAGKIELQLQKSDGDLLLKISDNGIGLPDTVSFESSSGLGMQLIQGMAQQLNGKIMLTRENGTQFLLQIPLDTDKQSKLI